MNASLINDAWANIRRHAAFATLCAAACLAAWAGCGTPVNPGENEVLMQGLRFVPEEIHITVGETVTWRNVDFVPHTATSGNPGDADAGSVFRVPGQGNLTSGQSGSATFDEPGEFVYYCELHPTMMRNARVIVEP